MPSKMLHYIAAKAVPSLIWRGIVFLALLVLISGVNGQRIIGGGILFRDGFAIYSTIGKVLIFCVIVFLVLSFRRKTAIALKPWRPILLDWFVLSLAGFVAAWLAIGRLLAGEAAGGVQTAAHAGLIVSVIAAGIGCFGIENLTLLWRAYKKEITVSLAVGGIFFGFLQLVYALWEPLAAIVLIAVRGLLAMAGLDAALLPPYTLIFDKFSITIAQYCSGIESIALFTGFYVLVGLLDWKKFNKRRYFGLFPLALGVLCVCNILRVFGLILAGYHINASLAFGLFHTYAGTVFFIMYSALFWCVAYRYMCQKKAAAVQEEA